MYLSNATPAGATGAVRVRQERSDVRDPHHRERSGSGLMRSLRHYRLADVEAAGLEAVLVRTASGDHIAYAPGADGPPLPSAEAFGGHGGPGGTLEILRDLLPDLSPALIGEVLGIGPDARG
jgi:hypothetical protein